MGGTHVDQWLTHVDVWQKPTQYCKALILQLKINLKAKKKIKKKIPALHLTNGFSSCNCVICLSTPLQWGAFWKQFEKGTVASVMCFLSAKPSPGSART